MAKATKYLITGAAGFIGSHLVEELLEQGVAKKQLRLFVFNDESLENLPFEDFEIIRGDIRDKQTVEKSMRDIDVVYHLAARVDFDGRTYADYFDTNVQGTQNLLDAAVANKVKKFIFFSSIGVFGMPADVGPIDKWDETHPKTYSNFYGLSKYEGELRVRSAFELHKLPFAIVRPASVYGPREKGPTLGLFHAISSGQFALVGDGKNLMHYVYVKDLVKGAILAEKSRKEAGDYILAGAQPVRFKDVISAVYMSLGLPVKYRKIPLWIAYPVAYALEAFGRVIGWKPPLFPSRIRTMLSSYSYSIEKARREIGYKPRVNFSQGAGLMGKWFLENGKL